MLKTIVYDSFQKLTDMLLTIHPVFQSSQAGRLAFLSGTKHNQHILFEKYSAACTKKASKVRNMHRHQLNYRNSAITVFHPTTRLKLMQAFKSRAGRPIIQARPFRNTASTSVPKTPRYSEDARCVFGRREM
jgi:hypothetical protein